MEIETVHSIAFLIAGLVAASSVDRIQEKYEGVRPESGAFFKVLQFVFLTLLWPAFLIMGFLYGKSAHDSKREQVIELTGRCALAYGLPFMVLWFVF
ncbi:hypothetical protein [Tateyamaria sp. ANG-S1]|uniref:hypothetical protein n=1 Tax=Tateyamaria sp. ANG-S1 TaxID=1577905 RepID=UPI00126A22F3|nr:hypothetical protein [Tateyamaria sp. ANG-S1]